MKHYQPVLQYMVDWFAKVTGCAEVFILLEEANDNTARIILRPGFQYCDVLREVTVLVVYGEVVYFDGSTIDDLYDVRELGVVPIHQGVDLSPRPN